MKTNRGVSDTAMPRLCRVAVLAYSIASSALGANYYWDNNGTTAGFGTAGGTWAVPTVGNATNGWSTSVGGSVVPGNVTTSAADDLNFGTASLALGEGTVTITGTVTTRSLTFGSASGAIHLSGGTAITLSGVNPSIAAQNNNNTFRTRINFSPTSGRGAISFSLPTSRTVGTLSLNGGFSGAGGVTFTTPNVSSGNWLQNVVLGAACTYSGDTTLTAGNSQNSTMVQCGVANALPPATVLTIDGGNVAGGGRACHFNLNGFHQSLAGLASVTGLTLRT